MINYPSQYHNSLLYLSFERHEELQVVRWQYELQIQLNHCVSSVEAFLLLELRLLGQQNIQSQEQEVKILLVGL